MNRFQILASIACLIAAMANVTDPYAQSKDQQLVAILDVEQVFKKDAIFNAKLDSLKTRADELKNGEAKSLEKMKEAKAELTQLESDAYAECFERMSKVVDEFARENNINMVLRANTNKINMKDRAEVLKRINSQIVYHRKLDLTNLVIEKMKKSSDVSTTSETSIRTPNFCDQCGTKLSQDHIHAKCDCLELLIE